MRFPGKKKLIAAAAALLFASLPGCGGAIRVCSGCKYKSSVAFSGLPTGTITSAQVTVKVKHSGACPQSDKPANCTEVMVYDVKCKLGTASSINVPFFIDAASTNRTHTATLVVVKSGVTTTHAGSIDFSSNVDGGPPGPPPSSIPTPCPPPAMNPYNPFPAIE